MGFLFIVGIGVVAWVVIHQIRQAAAADEAWERASRLLEGRFESGGFTSRPFLSGQLEGLRVQVTTKTSGSGNHRKIYTVYRVLYESAGFSMTLSEQGFFSGVKKLFGGRDVEVGDPAFDDHVIVDTAAEKWVVEFLTPGRRRAVRAFLASHDDAEITDTALSWVTSGRERDHVKLVAALRRGVRTARELGFGPDGLTAPTEQWGQPDASPREYVAEEVMPTAVVIEHVPEQPPHEFAEDSPIAGPDSVTDTPSETVPNAIPDELPDGTTAGVVSLDDDLTPPSEVERSDERPPIEPIDAVLSGAEPVTYFQPEPAEASPASVPPSAEDGADAPSDPEPPQPIEPVANDGPLVSEVMDALFGLDVSAYDASKYFDDHYESTTVSWDGAVQRVDSFSVDLALGNGPGRKVTVKIGSVEQRFGGPKDILVVARLADDAPKPAVGDAFTVEGTLVKMDSFMRTLYVTPPTGATPS